MAEGEQDEVKEKRTPQEVSKFWQEQLDLAKKDHRDWTEDGKAVVARYKRGKSDKNRSKRLNILYANTDHLRSAVYGKPPKSDVRRRFGNDPVAQQVAQLLEKALTWCEDQYDSDAQFDQAVMDYLLPGRGVVRVEYEPVFGKEGDKEYITDQKLRDCYVYWEDFLCMPARTWANIKKNGWVSFRHTMSREELVANFGDIGWEAPLNWQPDVAERNVPDSLRKAEVYEIWDITDRTRIWIVEGFDKPLRTDEDPYKLQDFFPVAEPVCHYKTTDTVIPEPEFHVYKDQADDLDENTNRISRLTRALKRRGVYDASIKELSRLANAGDNVFIPCDNYQNLASKGGLAKAFESEDISVIATVLLQLHQQHQLLIQQIWEEVGIADIMRGSTQASETLGAQELKAQFGSQRLKRRQRAVQKWLRDTLRLKAEIIAEHFEPDILSQMTGMELVPVQPVPTGNPEQDMAAQQAYEQKKAQADEMMRILREDKLRSFRIDVETDSTVFEDAEAEKKSRSDMIEAVTIFVQGWAPIVAQSPALIPLAMSLLEFGLGGFKANKSIDEAMEQAKQGLIAASQQPKPPSPEEMKAENEKKKGEVELALKAKEAELTAAIKQQESQQKMALAQQEFEQKRQLAAEQANLQREQMASDAALKREMAVNDAAVKRESMSHDANLKREMSEKEFGHKREMDSFDRQTTRDVEMEKAKRTLLRNGDAEVEVDPGALGNALAGALEPLVQVMVQSQQQTQQVLAMTAETNKMVANAVQGLGAPRRRVAVRDETGRLVEAHDLPMQ